MSIEAWLGERTAGVGLGGQAERVVQALARAPQMASYASAREVAERAGVNVSTVVRTAQQIGFDGWPDLRVSLRAAYLASSAAGESVAPATNDAAALMLHQDAANLAGVATTENIAAIRAIAAAIAAARRTVVIATGSGAGPAQILAYLASFHGYDIQVAAGPPTTQAVQVAPLGPEDCLVVVNVWRLTRAIRGLTRIAAEQGVTVAVLTDLRASPLTADAAHAVITPIEGIDPAPSLTAMVGVVQAILAELRALAEPDRRGTAGRIEQAWNSLDLMDDQA
ncbi:MurR/RpiR family transcriptional regulator [Tsukamurella pseudospumae]|uniref:Transcriptional regulator n=1 Tax=Tsukamurella pseudospumae TaxID=239498 RepID=A0A137ZXQ5_9ACTN|nr:MurR/RpiR family transcriptional regulator [Tsukamurella pseudospumae]KXO98329.1 transcriptional regulator [Tsukamurella pseudospumae]KXP02988.1 transcriptional regulator [Tsukamurella pseudospumae]